MTATLVLRADDIPPTPWKNGGGWARDLLVLPGGEGGAAGSGWRLRISLADITQDGPFSAYPGITRWFAVVEGEGVALQFGAGPTTLRRSDAPICFDGAAAPGCRLLAGPTRDLNLMLNGGRGRMARGLSNDEDWPLRGRYDIASRTLHWGLPAGPLQAEGEQLWIGVAP